MRADRVAAWIYKDPPASMARPLTGAAGFMVILGFWIADGRSVWPFGLVWVFLAAVFVWAAWVRIRHDARRADR